MQEKIKVILDTDIGSDIDDAVALAYLLKQPKCEILGITTVSGESDKRARLASAICKNAGRDIPIHMGADVPMIGEQLQKEAIQAKALTNWEHEKDFEKYTAVEFLRKTIRENPGEVVLIAIGPLTNIGALFAADPEIPSLLKKVVLMNGKFFPQEPFSGYAEWNTRCDAMASAIVFSAPVEIVSVGIDVTSKVVINREEARKSFKADVLKPVADFAEEWFKVADHVTFHDPLAVVALFNEDVCEYLRGNVSVQINEGKLNGLTLFEENKNGNCLVARSVDVDKFFKLYFETVNS